jgi:biotin synthase
MGEGIDRTLNTMAVLRLLRPDWVIPAVSALNLAEPGMGYRRGLRTGANLCTINLTPGDVRGDYLLYRRDRVIMNEERILKAIADTGYKGFVAQEFIPARPDALGSLKQAVRLCDV